MTEATKSKRPLFPEKNSVNVIVYITSLFCVFFLFEGFPPVVVTAPVYFVIALIGMIINRNKKIQSSRISWAEIALTVLFYFEFTGYLFRKDIIDFEGTIYFVLFIFGLYFLPSILAHKARVTRTHELFVFNILFGWTIVGWFACLATAIILLIKEKGTQPQTSYANN